MRECLSLRPALAEKTSRPRQTPCWKHTGSGYAPEDSGRAPRVGRTVGPSWCWFAASQTRSVDLPHMLCSHSHSLGRKRRFETLANPSTRLWEVCDWLAFRPIRLRGNGLLFHRLHQLISSDCPASRGSFLFESLHITFNSLDRCRDAAIRARQSGSVEPSRFTNNRQG
jgi:hypothetical protein